MENYLLENRHLRFAEICDERQRQRLQYIRPCGRAELVRERDAEKDLVACKRVM